MCIFTHVYIYTSVQSLSPVQLFVTPQTAAQYVYICIHMYIHFIFFFLIFYWTFRLFLIFCRSF